MPRRSLLVVAAAGLLLAAGVARADQKELVLSAQPGVAVVHIDNRTAWGGGGGLDLSYGLTDALAIRITTVFTAHHVDPTASVDGTLLPGGSVLGYHVGAGLTYTMDILRVVPYLDFSVGLLGTVKPQVGGGTVNDNNIGIQIGLGVDYLINRRFAVGLFIRYHAALTALSSIPVYLYAGPRIAIHFGL